MRRLAAFAKITAAGKDGSGKLDRAGTVERRSH
jgi:hypothetical protein